MGALFQLLKTSKIADDDVVRANGLEQKDRVEFVRFCVLLDL